MSSTSMHTRVSDSAFLGRLSRLRKVRGWELVTGKFPAFIGARAAFFLDLNHIKFSYGFSATYVAFRKIRIDLVCKQGLRLLDCSHFAPESSRFVFWFSSLLFAAAVSLLHQSRMELRLLS